MSSDVEKIKEALPIEDVVASYIKLEPSGKYLKAQCPFHNERTPSFVVTPERQTFHCFGCGKGGDSIGFIQEIEGVEFYDALKLLADRAGIRLTGKKDSTTSNKQTLYNILDAANSWFEVQLRRDKEVVAYLQERGLSTDTLARFRIGYAPAAWDGVYKYLSHKGYSDALLQQVGLISQGKKGYIDQFRDRIMFPITDTQGRVVAFSGRVFIRPHEQENPPEYKLRTGKYINSPETSLFVKSKILYGYHTAKDAMRTKRRAVVVEGQFDCLASHQAGVEETVAISGTALTQEQITLIQRFTQHIVLAFDMDKAGLSAMYKSALLGFENGLAVSVIPMRKGDDPASYILEHGGQAWEQVVDDARGYVPYLLHLLKHGTSEIKAIARIEAKVFPLLARMELAAERDAMLRKMASMLHVSEQSVQQDFMKYMEQDAPTRSVDTTPDTPKQQQSILSRKEQLIHILFGCMWWLETQKESKELAKTIQTFLQKQLKEVYDDYENNLKTDQNRLVFEAEMRYDRLSKEKLVHELQDLQYELTRCLLESQRDSIGKRLHEAEQVQDEQLSQKLLQEYNTISQKLHTITYRS